MTQETLLPCPFCDAEAAIREGDSDIYSLKPKTTYMVCCDGCGVETPFDYEKESVIKLWNTRA